MRQLKLNFGFNQIKEKARAIFSGSNFLKSKDEINVGINIGSRYLKGLVLRQSKVSDYFTELNQDLPKTLKKIWSEKKSRPKQ